jgi:23S rRNA pseudouridine2605 synthase
VDEKLQKVLARAGYGSRRVMETWISAGRIKVNGAIAGLGDRVGPDDKILVDGKKLAANTAIEVPQRILLYNKPIGEICTRDDPEGRKTVFDNLPELHHARWVVIGRLDINTSGLLLFTTDGELANRLMHPSSQVEREYAVRVLGDVSPEMIAAMHEGVMLEDGKARFTDIQYFAGENSNHWYHVVILEGRNREVRRLWESQGVRVSRLKRVRFGNIFIPSQISVGRYCELGGKEARDLYHIAGLKYRPTKKPVMRRSISSKKSSASFPRKNTRPKSGR